MNPLRHSGSRLWASRALVVAVFLGAQNHYRPPAYTADAQPPSLFAEAAANAESVPRHGVFELTLTHNGSYKDNFHDVTLTAVFTSPDGTERTIRGFYYGRDQWKIRFSPDLVGRWTYSYTLEAGSGFRKTDRGTFNGLPSDAAGPVRIHPRNPFGWVFGNGEAYFPRGLQDCIWADGEELRPIGIDGESREARGPLVTVGEYFRIYGEAGFNLFRFSQRNCSYELTDAAGHYRVAESIATDKLLSLARQHGFRVMYGIFGSEGTPVRLAQSWGSADQARLAEEKRFIDYSVARWGVYVDLWELLNETRASDEWTAMMAGYVRSIDPDRKPISTSNPMPHLPEIDIASPHWYESEDELRSDRRLRQRATVWKRSGKPVLVGEQGNSNMNWDPRSALRMRIRSWTALFEEIGLIFWNTSWSKAGMFRGVPTPRSAANIYLGPEERGYIRVLADFSSRLDADVRRTALEISGPSRLRAYGLRSESVAAAYVRHVEDHVNVVRGAEIVIDVPGRSGSALDGEWIDPETGKVLQRISITPGSNKLTVPPFRIDLALLIAPRATKRASAAVTEGSPR